MEPKEKTPITKSEVRALRITCRTMKRIANEMDVQSPYLPGMRGTVNDLYRTYGEIAA